jgi:hypothetical protein
VFETADFATILGRDTAARRYEINRHPVKREDT